MTDLHLFTTKTKGYYIFFDNFKFLQVWDTGGQERYRPVLATCYKNAFGVILVYDVTNKKTFSNLQQWLAEVNEFNGADLPKLLVGMIFLLFSVISN